MVVKKCLNCGTLVLLDDLSDINTYEGKFCCSNNCVEKLYLKSLKIYLTNKKKRCRI